VSEKGGSFVLVTSEVNYDKVVGVDINGLVSDKQLFATIFIVLLSQNLHVDIADVQFVVPHGKIRVLGRIILIELDEVESDFTIFLVAQKVELFCLTIVNDVVDQTDTEKFIEIHVIFVRLKISMKAVLLRSYTEIPLLFTEGKYLWLTFERWLERFNRGDDLSLVIQLEYFILLSKDDTHWFLTRCSIFEVILHADFGELWHILDNDPLDLLPLSIFGIIFTRLFLKNEKLVLLLLVHDQVLATNDG
jgi:hypothetical protein